MKLSNLILLVGTCSPALVAVGGTPAAPRPLPRQERVTFEPNRGQAPAQYAFVARARDYIAYLSTTEIAIRYQEPAERRAEVDDPALGARQRHIARRRAREEARNAPERPALIRFELAAEPGGAFRAAEELQTRTVHLDSRDGKTIVQTLPHYARLDIQGQELQDVMSFYDARGSLEYDIHVPARRDPNSVEMRVHGARRLRLDGDDLLVDTERGRLRIKRPASHQQIRGTKVHVESDWVIKGNDRVGFRVRGHRRGEPLTIDPVILWEREYSPGLDLVVDRSGFQYQEAAGGLDRYRPDGSLDANFVITNAGVPVANVENLAVDGRSRVWFTDCSNVLPVVCHDVWMFDATAQVASRVSLQPGKINALAATLDAVFVTGRAPESFHTGVPSDTTDTDFLVRVAPGGITHKTRLDLPGSTCTRPTRHLAAGPADDVVVTDGTCVSRYVVDGPELRREAQRAVLPPQVFGSLLAYDGMDQVVLVGMLEWSEQASFALVGSDRLSVDPSPWRDSIAVAMTRVRLSTGEVVSSILYQETVPSVTILMQPAAVALDAEGNAFVSGLSQRLNPAWIPLDPNSEYWLGDDAFLVKVRPDGEIADRVLLATAEAYSGTYGGGVWPSDEGDIYWSGLRDFPNAGERNGFIARLEGKSFRNEACRECPNVGEPVNVTTGNTWLNQVDAALPAIGRPLVMTRVYNSFEARSGAASGFGSGWTHPFQKGVSIAPGSVIRLREANGAPVLFRPQPDRAGFWASAADGDRSWFEGVAGQWIRHQQDGGRETYDRIGRLVAMVSPLGLETRLTYSGERLERIEDANGRYLRLEYADFEGKERIVALHGPEGRLSSYRYAGAERWLEEVTYLDGSGYRFEYDGDGQLLRLRDATGRLLEKHAYVGGRGVTSEKGEGVALTSSAGVQERLTLDYQADRTVVTDQRGSTTTYEWTAFGQNKKLTRQTTVDGVTSQAAVQTWTYTPQGRVETYTDALNRVMRYTYNDHGDVLTETDEALARTATYTYTYEGERITQKTRTAPGEGTTTWQYGLAGIESASQTLGEGASRTTTYTYEGPRLKTVAVGNAAPTTFHYFPNGDLQKTVDGDGVETSYTYDTMGRMLTRTDVAGTTTWEYAAGRLTSVLAPDGGRTKFEYDAAGRQTAVIDAKGRRTGQEYDHVGRLVAVTDTIGGQTRYTYDAMSNMASLTDALGRTTVWTRNGAGQVLTTTYPGGATETTAYDAVGRVQTHQDRRNVTTTYTYDPVGRLQEKSFSDGTPTVTYTYDAVSRLQEVTSGGVAGTSVSWTFNEAGEILAETTPAGVVEYTYDGAGRRQTLRVGAQDFLTYDYTPGGRLQTLSRGAKQFALAYDGGGRRFTLAYPNGASTQYAYQDPVGRLTGIDAILSGVVRSRALYTYDIVGNRTSRTTLGQAETYGYDALDRLTQVDRSGALYQRFAYDAVGNRTTAQLGQQPVSANHDERNRLLSRGAGGSLQVRGTVDEPAQVQVNGQPARLLSGGVFEASIDTVPGTNTFTVQATDGSGNVDNATYEVQVSGAGTSYGYDASGDLTSKLDPVGSWGYEWDAESRLQRVTLDGAEVARFGYDPLGRRIEKIAAGVTTRWQYDGQDIMRETSTVGTVTTEYRYMHGPGIDEPFARENVGAATWEYYHADGLGSIQSITDDAGNVAHTFEYDAWGNIETGAERGGYAYTGREWDPETGLYYYRARYYDPKAGRFISEDPIGFEGGSAAFYTYSQNNPVNFVDPLGLAAVGDVVFFNFGANTRSTYPHHAAVVTQVDASGTPTHAFGGWGDTMTFHEVDLSQYAGGVQQSIIGTGSMEGLSDWASVADFMGAWNGRSVAPDWDGSRGLVCIDVATATDGYGGAGLRAAMKDDFKKNGARYPDYGEGKPNPANDIFFRKNPWLQQFFRNTGRYTNVR